MFRFSLIRRRWDRDADILLDYFGANGLKASSSYARKVNKAFKGIKAVLPLSEHYLIYDFSAELDGQGLVNWVSPGAFTLTKAGTVTHAALQGFTAGGTTADGLQTGWNPSTAGVGTDDVSVSLWRRNSTAATSRLDWGLQSANWFARIRNTGDLASWRLNNTATLALPSGITNTTGFWTWNRAAASVGQLFRNGAQFDSDVALTSQATPNSTLNFLNCIIGSNTSSLGQFSFAMVSKGRTAAREANLYLAIQAFLSAKGTI